jgi:hypothetical protein
MTAPLELRVMLVAFIAIASLLAVVAWSQSAGTPAFVDVAKQAGLSGILVDGTPEKKSILDVNGTGTCWFDFNNDGLVDLFFVNGSTVKDLQSQAPRPQSCIPKRRERKITDVMAAGISGKGWGQGCVAADYDNDGLTDLLVTNFGPNELFHNNGNGTFSEVAGKAGVSGGVVAPGAAFAINNDGWLDLFVAGYVVFDVNSARTISRSATIAQHVLRSPRFRGAPHFLYRNNHDGTFSNVTERRGF